MLLVSSKETAACFNPGILARTIDNFDFFICGFLVLAGPLLGMSIAKGRGRSCRGVLGAVSDKPVQQACLLV